MAGRSVRTCIVVLALVVGRPAGAVTHPAVTVLSGQPETAASVASKAYANAFRSVGYTVSWVRPAAWEGTPGEVVVIAAEEAATLDDDVRDRLVAFVDGGGRLVTALGSPLARALGLRFGGVVGKVVAVSDETAPGLAIRWQAPITVHPFRVPVGGRTIAWARGRKVPLVATFRHGLGRVLFLAVELDDANPLGTSRFPYFLQAVGSAFDVAPALTSPHIVAYADLGDHDGEDPEALAAEWWRRGIREVHVGTWDAWGEKLRLYERLIAACHRRGILVYAWFELPEVSTPFWDRHPEWREKTATGEDAHVDWRRLMALSIPECFEAVAREVEDLLQRFDWDGADLAEVYFESPMGLERPDRFTPMNRSVREEFRQRSGFDPKDLFDEDSPRYFERDPIALTAFLAYRRDKTVELHERFLRVIAGVRTHKPDLDVVVTLIDALYDRTMRDFIAVDTARVAALAKEFPFELQVEDPFTLWSLGPERYAKIASDYVRFVQPSQRLALDVNVVPREDDVHPTLQQTGLELYRLMAEARRAFPKVCLYSEASIYRQDHELLLSALASASRLEPSGAHSATVESDGTVELSTEADPVVVRLDGREWPAVRGGAVLLPRGRHTVEWEASDVPADRLRLLGLTGVLLDAASDGVALSVRYASHGRAFVLLPFRPVRAAVDGKPLVVTIAQNEFGFVLSAPPGEHVLMTTP